MRERRVQLLGARCDVDPVRRELRRFGDGRGQLRSLREDVRGGHELSGGRVHLRRAAGGLRERLREQSIGRDELRHVRQRVPHDDALLFFGRVFCDLRLHSMRGRRVREHDGQ